MKSKFFLLSTIISSCILTIACNQSTADELNSKTLAYDGQQGAQYAPYAPQQGRAGTNPNMPTAPGNVNGQRPCYPASRCTGNPGSIGGGYGNNYGASSQAPAPTGKVLQIESTEKFVGTVQSINRVALPDQTQIQMILTTDQGDLMVILGPASFIDQQKIKFQAGDKVTVLGYRVKANGADVITAAQVQKNGTTLQLLDNRRQPVWGGNSN